MSVSKIITSLDVTTQLPLDHKGYFQTLHDLTFYGVDDVLVYKYFEGMTVYCLEDDSFYRWLDTNKPKDDSYIAVGNPFIYPSGTVSSNGIIYSNRSFSFYKVVVDVDLSKIEGDLDSKIDAALEASKEYSDILDRQALGREQNLKDTLEGTMDYNQAQSILDLENAKRELYEQMASTSDQLVTDLEGLKDDFNKQKDDVQNSLDTMNDALNNLPTDQILTDVQLDNLKYLRNTISQEYGDIDFKINRVLGDAFMPEDLKPGIIDLQKQGQRVHTELVNVIDKALEDKKVSQEEKDAINAKMDEFSTLTDLIHVTILGVYDKINENMDQYFSDRLSDTMKELQLYFEYSKDGRTNWHKEFVEGDKYMRMKNGIAGAWSDSIKIVGENGTGGRYTDYQFSKNKELMIPPTTGWSDAPPEIEPDEYLWMRVGEVMPPMTYPEYWTTVRMSGPQGHPGIQGDRGLQGKPGIDGKSSYTHIAYAEGPNGEGFSQVSTGKTYVGFYVDFEELDSSDPKKYAWTLIKGHDGANGLPGAVGPDGKPSYLHIAYADSADGKVGFSITDGTNKKYLGQYVDSIKADSTDPTKYSWTLIKGEKGDQGPKGTDGLQGPKGDQGIPGKAGVDGKISYTHIAYADTDKGAGLTQNPTGKPYIGIYTDYVATDSNDPLKYKWSLIKGLDGAQGIPGKAGANGKTPYFHIAYANSADGTKDFSVTVSTNKLFIGTYTDFVQADSTDPKKYNWSRMRDERVISTTEPSNKYIGLTWIDTSKVPYSEKFWNGSSWQLIGISESGIADMIKDANEQLKDTMDNAMADGIISNNEARAIAENISVLESNKRQLDVKYNSLYNDPKLTGTPKTDLNTKKTSFNTAHTNLMTVCQAIAKKTKITAAEKTDYTNKQNAYNSALDALGKSLDAAQAAIYLANIDGIIIGGRNLLKKSGVKVTNTSYPTKAYDLVTTHKYTAGTDYTITVWGSLGAGKTHFAAYNSGGTVSLGSLVSIGNGMYRVTFKWAAGANTSVSIYPMPNTVTGVNSTIERVKLEVGTKGTDWTPASEDQQDQIDHAINDAAQAKAISEEARSKTNFLGPATSTGNGLITGAALLVGSSAGNNAGIVGVTDKAQDSVRFYAGAEYSKKDTAPFRVLNNGNLFATRANISGTINATGGMFGGFTISSNTIQSNNKLFELLDTGLMEFRDTSKRVRMRIGLATDGVPAIIFYDTTGEETWRAGSQGIVYKDNIPESWTTISLWKLQDGTAAATNAQKLALINNKNKYKKQITRYMPPEQGFPAQYNGKVTMEALIGAEKVVGYMYSAGENPLSDTKRKYEGFVYSSKDYTLGKVANALYCSNYEASSILRGYGYRDPDSILDFDFNFMQTNNGVPSNTNLKVKGNVSPDSPIDSNGQSRVDSLTFTL